MADVLIVGGGLAGLACARELTARKISFRLFEASDAVGGRARTDELDGFLLDRGFQVLLTAYPEAQRVFNYQALQLGNFMPGALFRYGNSFHLFADPWRQPGRSLETLFLPVGVIGDKMKVASLRHRLMSAPIDEILPSSCETTLHYLEQSGFSSEMIDSFFRPFFGGVFLDYELSVSRGMFEFIFRMFAEGHAALPAAGMGALAKQLAAFLPPDSIKVQCAAAQVTGKSVVLASGEVHTARAVVLATDATNASSLSDQPAPSWRGTTCLYFAADKSPIREPILVLNGSGDGPVNHLCVPNLVAPTYAPPGASLISVSVIGTPAITEQELRSDVLYQCSKWFGNEVQGWRHLRTYIIPRALPQPLESNGNGKTFARRLRDGVYLCGDYCETASIQGALLSGYKTAEAIAAELS